MAASPNSPAATPQARRWIIFAALCSLIALALVAFFGVGRWLVVEDPLAKARAIVVLSGGMPVRALEAARLHAQGYAPEVWLTHSPEPGESLKAMGIPYEGEEVYSARVLIHEGVPAGAIHVRSEEHTSELQSRGHLVCRLLLEKKKQQLSGRGSSRL